MGLQDKARIYSVNEGNYKAFPEGVKAFVEEAHNGEVRAWGLRVGLQLGTTENT